MGTKCLLPFAALCHLPIDQKDLPLEEKRQTKNEDQRFWLQSSQKALSN